MSSNLRCKMMGHDRDACGVCGRCGDEDGANHEFQEAERNHPCVARSVCERCGKERTKPEHDWQTGTSALTGDVELKCSHCGLKI